MERVLHVTCVAIGDHGVLIAGDSGAGKSDLALRLIDRGAVLVSDDYTRLRPCDCRLMARAPVTIAGRIEVRGLGIVAMPHRESVEIVLLVMLTDTPERLPPGDMRRSIAGVPVRMVAVDARAASAPITVELALAGAVQPGIVER
ncbi:HPr kinase/phosphorylase [uncultured Sphingomonas sp.]|uniref:HPr kinase/phosphorylase n=1 Tax=uncultured Sphingomonas sp. TaxID=158754 RepID=UPI0035C994AB